MTAILFGCLVEAIHAVNDGGLPLTRAQLATWSSTTGDIFDLSALHDSTFRIDLPHPMGAVFEISLGKPIRCGDRVHPARIAACVSVAKEAGTMSGESSSIVGLKASIQIMLIVPSAPDFGVRVIHKYERFGWTTTVAELDCTCDPFGSREEGDWEAAGRTSNSTHFFMTLRWGGCCRDEVASHSHIAAEAAGLASLVASGASFSLDGSTLVWQSAAGAIHDYNLEPLFDDQPYVDIPDYDRDDGLSAVFELSLDLPLHCGADKDPDAIVACVHDPSGASIVIGMKRDLTVWRVHEHGLSLRFTGGDVCIANTRHQNSVLVVLTCDKQVSEWIATVGTPDSNCMWTIGIRSKAACAHVVRRADPPPSPITLPATVIADVTQSHSVARLAPPDPESLHPELDGMIGCFSGNCDDGVGSYRWATGSIYEGSFERGKRHGYGVHNWADGRRYSGEWYNGLRHGVGSHVYLTGDAYSGNWLADRRHGQGTFEWADGRIYRGMFDEDEVQGIGQQLWPDGRTYIGNWAEGKLMGYGKMTWLNGTMWVGEWHDDHQTHDGILLCGPSLILAFGTLSSDERAYCVAKCPQGSFEDTNSRRCSQCLPGCSFCTVADICIKCDADKHLRMNGGCTNACAPNERSILTESRGSVCWPSWHDSNDVSGTMPIPARSDEL